MGIWFGFDMGFWFICMCISFSFLGRGVEVIYGKKIDEREEKERERVLV